MSHPLDTGRRPGPGRHPRPGGANTQGLTGMVARK